MNQRQSGVKVSFVMPAYNYEDYIGRAIESLLAQSDGAWELLIVNDCSSDGTLAVCQRYAEQDERIQLIDLPQNCGQYMVINDFAPQGQGEYSCVLDADDYLAPDFVKQMYACAKRHDFDVLLCQHQNFSGRRKLDKMNYGGEIPAKGLRDSLLVSLMKLEYFIIDCGSLVRTELRRKLQPLLPQIPMYAATDSMQALFLAQHAASVGCLQKPLYIYNQGSVGTWRNRSDEFLHKKCYSAFLTLNMLYHIASHRPDLYVLDISQLPMVRSIRARLREGLRGLSDSRRRALLRQVAETVASRPLPTYFSAASLLDLLRDLPVETVEENPVSPEEAPPGAASLSAKLRTRRKRIFRATLKIQLRYGATMAKPYLPYGLVRILQKRQQNRLWEN